MTIVIQKWCLLCDWKSKQYDAGPSGRMMGVNTAGNLAEDEFDQHWQQDHGNE